MGEWKEYLIGDILKLEYGKSLKDYRNDDGVFKVFGTNGPIGTTSVSLFDGPSVIIGRKGAYRGAYYSEDPGYVIDTAYYTLPIVDDLDMKFIYYWFLFLDVNNLNSGSAIPSTSRDEVYATPIRLPKIVQQKRIAHTLSLLDAKIDLLRQQNETLEALGAAVFREWFSRKEYDKEPISSVLKIVGGGTPSTKVEEYWNGSIFWTTPKDLSTNSGTYLRKTLRTISEEGLEKISSGLLHKGTLLMSSRAPVGYLAFAGIPLAINQGYIAIVEASYLPLNYVYYWLKANMSYIKQSSNGSVFQEISKTVFRSLDIEVPDEDALAAFDRFVSPILAKIEFNQAETEKLEETRDLLLPKLMSGQVKVRTDG